MNEMQTFLGKIGEKYACDYLKKQGLSIRAKNFHSAFGEIDIVAEEQKTLVFVEVKLRKSTDHGSPVDFISPWKQDKIRKTAEKQAKTGKNIWLSNHFTPPGRWGETFLKRRSDRVKWQALNR